MHRSILGLMLGLSVVTAASCSTSDSTVVEPSPLAITEPDFTGTIGINGSATLPFGATQAGLVTATITALSPNTDNLAAIGLQLGISSGLTCQAVITAESAGVGTALTGQANASGLLCVRVYDNGTLRAPINFTVQVVHF